MDTGDMRMENCEDTEDARLKLVIIGPKNGLW
jgi:hypothetical protein